jgi:TRAP-type C4-dicarboxylate transport system substrate-binding protein
MSFSRHFQRRTLLTAAAALSALALPAVAQTKTVLRISTPAVPDAWHAKMWTVFKDALEKSAPGEFDVQINLNASLFKQGAEPAAMARGNLELTSVSAADIAKLVPDFSVFTAGYMLRDPVHQQKVFSGPIGAELFKTVSDKMGITVLSTCYLGTRQLNLREARKVQTPADLKGVKLRMPGSKDWLFLGNALGATATPLAFGEVYLGLKTGTIDGQDNPLPSVRAAAQAAANYNNDNTVNEETQLVEFFKKQGLQVTTPDVAAFRKSVQTTYQASDYAKTWSAGLVERINATH